MERGNLKGRGRGWGGGMGENDYITTTTAQLAGLAGWLASYTKVANQLPVPAPSLLLFRLLSWSLLSCR